MAAPMEEKIKFICIYLLLSFTLFLFIAIITNVQLNVKADTIHVGPGQTYTSIQEGIDAANPGDTVYVYASIYYENVIVNKTINLTGENKSTTIIDGNGSGNCLHINSTDYINISGFTIRNGSYGIYINSSSHCNISDNIIHENSVHGIFLLSSSWDNIIAYNKIYNSTFGGIYLKSSSDNYILNNIVNNTLSGISIDQSNHTLIAANVAYNNSFNGIEISSSFNNNLINNTIFDINGNGILLIKSTTATVNNNLINNTWYGILVDRSDNNFITNNVIYNNSNFGIAQTRSYNNTCLNNTISNNTRGIHLFKSANNSFSSNELNDGDYGISVQESNDNFFEKNNISNFEYGLYIAQMSVNNTYINISIFGGDYGIYSRDQSKNTIINCSISNTNIYDFYLSENSHVVALNTIFLSKKVCFEDNLSNLSIEWYLMVYVNFTNGTPIKNAYIEVHDFYNELIKSDNTDINGYLQWIIIKERVQNSITNISYTPHNISAKYDSIMRYANPEPILNFTTQINITFKSEEVQNPLHHITIIPKGLERYYIGDSIIYIAIGWNDAAETQQNTTWIPVWSVDNTAIASIDSATGEFTTLVLGSGSVNVSDKIFTNICNISIFTIEPWPLHHIVITPLGPERYYVGDERSYSAIGWNNAEETQQNITWTPVWSVDNLSIATIISDTGEFTAIALGNGVVNVTAASTGIYNTSSFIVEPWPLHHIVITPLGPENYYVGDTQTYTVIGWNDAQETQMNTTWTPLWEVDDNSIATIGSDTGFFTATNIGNGNVICRSTAISEICNTSYFSVLAWPLHHINIIPQGPQNYYIGDTQIFTAVGWNDAEETQMNDTWVSVWSVGNTSVASINETGFFTAIALGSGVINVTCTSQPWVCSVVVFTVNPWPLHHISILPAGPETYRIGDIVIYTAIAWNDVEETQMNTTWTPVWTLEGGIQELTWEGEEARLEAKKSGEGYIKCSDEATNIYSTSDIVIEDKDKDGTSIWLWVLLVIIVVVFLIILFLIYRKKNQGNFGKEGSINNTHK